MESFPAALGGAWIGINYMTWGGDSLSLAYY